jgi:hypothetical protein
MRKEDFYLAVIYVVFYVVVVKKLINIQTGNDIIISLIVKIRYLKTN